LSGIAVAAAVAFGAMAGPARAAAWQPLGDVSPRTSFAPRADLLVTPDGTMRAVYTDGETLWVRTRAPHASGFGPPVQLSTGAPVRLYELVRGGPRPTVAWTERLAGDGGPERIMSAPLDASAAPSLVATAGGRVHDIATHRDETGIDRAVWHEGGFPASAIRFAEAGRVQTLAEGEFLRDPVIAVGSDGGALMIAWSDDERGVQVVNRARGATMLSAPRPVGPPAAPQSGKVLSHDGGERWLMAWTETYRPDAGARLVAARGTLDKGTTRRDVLSRPHALDVRTRLGYGRSDYVVSWQVEVERRPSAVQVAVASRDGGRFSVTSLSRGDVHSPRVEMSGGAVVLAWLRKSGRTWIVEGTRRDARGRWGPVDRASGPGAGELALAPAASDRVYAIWTRRVPEQPERIESALNDTGRFGRAVLVTQLARATDRLSRPAGFSVRNTRIAAMWRVTLGEGFFWQAAVYGGGV